MLVCLCADPKINSVVRVREAEGVCACVASKKVTALVESKVAQGKLLRGSVDRADSSVSATRAALEKATELVGGADVDGVV